MEKKTCYRLRMYSLMLQLQEREVFTIIRSVGIAWLIWLHSVTNSCRWYLISGIFFPFHQYCYGSIACWSLQPHLPTLFSLLQKFSSMNPHYGNFGGEVEINDVKETVQQLLRWGWKYNKNLEEQAAQLHMLTGWSQIVEVHFFLKCFNIGQLS